jgi:hypothetical protein
MDESKRESLLLEGSDEMTGGFNPLLLWRDRQRILAEPEIAARPRPPLSNAPVRYALALTLTPLLLVAWLSSLLVDGYPGRESAYGPIDARFGVTIEVLSRELPGLSTEAVKVLARSIRPRDMVAEAGILRADATRALLWQPMMAPEARQRRMHDWVARVRASRLTLPHQDVLIAQVLHPAQTLQPADRINAALMRSVAEGGPVMQAISVLSLLLAAWLFGQTLRHDARFRHAARADRFYLYYSTTRMFWFLPAQTLAYGVVSYASAAGDAQMFLSAQTVSLLISLASFVYLLAGSRTMAQALAGADRPLPPAVAWAIGWRVAAAMAAAMWVVMLVGIVLVSLLSFAVIELR